MTGRSAADRTDLTTHATGGLGAEVAAFAGEVVLR